MLRRIWALVALSLALTLVVVPLASHSPGTAFARGTTADTLTGHPAIGTWTFVIENEVSLFAFTGDGVVIASDQDGTSALGSWDSADERTARFTLIGLALDEDGAFSTVLRGTMTIDTAGDSATVDVSATLVGLDGTVYFSAVVAATASRLPVEGPDLTGSPVAGFPTVVATPRADRQEIHFEVTVEVPIGDITLTDDETATPVPTVQP